MLSRKTVGLLFADIDGYSKLAEHKLEVFITQVMPGVSKVLEPYRNTFVEVNTWGDGLVIASEDPHRLARLSLDLRDFYEHTNWEELHFEKQLGIRIALHAGTVFVGPDPIRNTHGITGVQVSRAARIEPVTPRNAIWASESFVAIAKGRKDATIAYHDVGSRDLAKKFGSEQLYCIERSGRNPTPSSLGHPEQADPGTNPNP